MLRRSFDFTCLGSFGLLLFCLVACSGPEESLWPGYAEGEFVYVASPRPGRLMTLHVSRGESIKSGSPLFDLEPAPESQVVDEARARMNQARFRFSDLGSGVRPDELAAIDARLRKATVEEDLARSEAERRKDLYATGAIGREEQERAVTAAQAAAAAVADLRAQRATALLGGRTAAQRAAAAEVEIASQQLAQAEWALQQKSVASLVPALVYDTLYRPGEFVAAGVPVVILLPPAQVLARFYVVETELAKIQPGYPVTLMIDGREEIPAEIVYVSPQAEYAPPLIYSSESRQRLVFMVKARPLSPSASPLNPGQPLSVKPRGRS
jgi:HlyD family secretion protein